MPSGLAIVVPDDLGRHEFDTLASHDRTRIDVRRGRPEDIFLAASLTYRSIDGALAPPQVVERVLLRNPNNILLFWRHGKIVGTWSMLMLRPKGLEALLLGELDLTDPEPDFLSTAVETPAAIYTWVVVAPGLAAEGIKLVADFLGKPLYASANLYARPTTRLGLDLSRKLGFKRIDGREDGLWRYRRLANRPPLLTVPV